MAMGTRRKRERQQDLWIATSDVVETPANVFYDRLNQILDEHAARAATRSHVSIHAARAGGDAANRGHSDRSHGFQSTPPVRAATCTVVVRSSIPSVSIHAARAGGDESSNN